MSEVNCKNCKWLEPDDDDMGFNYCPYWVSCKNGKEFEPKDDEEKCN